MAYRSLYPDIASAIDAEVALGHGATEADPFIILNDDNKYKTLLTAIETVGIYIKITQDFDFSVSEFKYSIPSVVSVNCKKLFADDKDVSGAKYYISGINCGNLNSFIVTVDGTINDYERLISNLDIVNVVFKPQAFGESLIHAGFEGYTAGAPLRFSDCRLSFLIISLSFMPILESSARLSFERTSIYCKFVMSDTSPYNHNIIVFNGLRSYCTTQFTGLKSCVDAGFGWPLIVNASYSTFYGDTVVTASGGNYPLISNSSNCCIAINFINGQTQTVPQPITITANSSISGVNIMDSEMSEMQDLITYNVASTVQLLTTQQMKDEDTLIEVGFLP